MIGNLILALGVAICCSAPLLKDNPPIQRVSGGGTSISNVSGNEGYLYLSDTFSFAPYDESNINAFYSASVNSRDSAVSYHNAGYANDYVNHVAETAQLLYTEYGESYYDFFVVGEFYRPNIWLCRFYLNIYSPIQNIEIYTNNHSAVEFGFGYGSYSALTSANATVNSDSWILFNDSIGISNSDLNIANLANQVCNRFNDFYFYLPSDENNNITITFNAFGSLDNGYQQGYDTGYSIGYNSGSQIGYQNGYSEGLSVGTGANANLLNLFGVVADTPIRFLKQMFSFELFGMNVAVVILSCLTAVIIFGIVKKVWK